MSRAKAKFPSQNLSKIHACLSHHLMNVKNRKYNFDINNKPGREKTCLRGFQQGHAKRAAQPQKMAIGLKFQI